MAVYQFVIDYTVHCRKDRAHAATVRAGTAAAAAAAFRKAGWCYSRKRGGWRCPACRFNTCAVCGGPFRPTSPNHKTCGRDCRLARARQQAAAPAAAARRTAWQKSPAGRAAHARHRAKKLAPDPVRRAKTTHKAAQRRQERLATEPGYAEAERKKQLDYYHTKKHDPAWKANRAAKAKAATTRRRALRAAAELAALGAALEGKTCPS